MDIGFIEKLIETVARSPIEELELERDGWRIRIAKSARSAKGGSRPAQATENPVPASWSDASHAELAQASHNVEQSRHLVRAFLTGTFYRSATENGPPLVSVGDSVEEGQHLGILEAMKVLNPIEAPLGGRVAEILVDNAGMVQAGDGLIVIEAA